jgi:ABC-2 type transport system permease protein
MRNTFNIALRELESYFVTPMAYVVIVFFLFFSGLIFTFSIYQPSARAQLSGLLGSMVFLTLMVAPFLTMSALAQERGTGTLELLLTKPVKDREVVLGKYFGTLAIYLTMLILTLPFPILMSKWGDFDWGPARVGYLGIFLVGASFIAIGLFASSLTRSQMASAGICLGAFLFVWLIGWVSYLMGGQESVIAQITKSISVFELFADFEKGILDSKNVVYFVSVAGFFLFLTTRVLEMRRQV